MAHIRESGENYLELILDISREQDSVRSIDIARRMGVSRASVSKALSILRDAGMVEPAYYGKVVLTEAGKNAQPKYAAGMNSFTGIWSKYLAYRRKLQRRRLPHGACCQRGNAFLPACSTGTIAAIPRTPGDFLRSAAKLNPIPH